MKQTKDVIAAVVDLGLFIHVARRLARDVAKVYYCPVWETDFPHLHDGILGEGYPELEWAESVWDVADKCDLIVFPDIGFSGLQIELERQGKAVWGCRNADGLEARRGFFLETLKQTGLPMPTYKRITGLTNLRLLLADETDKYIKVSTWRGDFETFHFRSIAEDGIFLDRWATTLGPLKETFTFFVLDSIDAVEEDGCDTWCIDGKWPKNVIHCLENKDKSALATFCRFDQLPDPVRLVNERFGPVLAKYGYRSFFSTEVRVTENGEGFFIDPTCRAPSPPSQVVCEMIENYGEVIWHGANGIIVEPEPVARFGVQSIFHVDRHDWEIFKILEEIEQFVKIGFSCMIDGNICVPPDPDGVEEIGWALGIGDSAHEAISHLKENVSRMPEGVTVNVDSLAELLITASENDFTPDKLPKPDVVLAD